MLRWAAAALTAAVMTGFAVLLLAGRYVREGPVLVTFSETHGLHRGDVGIMAAWALGMIGLLTSLLAQRRSRRSRH